jgi:hypothetical protein
MAGVICENGGAMKRRAFLQAGAAATLLAPQRIIGANDRIRVALIGAGGRGRSVTRYAAKLPDVKISTA